MKKLLCVLVFLSIIADAQTRNGKTMLAGKSVYAEFLGASFVVGLNYDARFNEYSRWGYRVGLAYGKGFNVPLEVNYLVGRRETKNKLDLGVGVNLACSGDGAGDFAFLNIGYRFQPKNGVIFRVGLSPKFVFYERDNWVENLQIWATMFLPYLSIGYAF